MFFDQASQVSVPILNFNILDLDWSVLQGLVLSRSWEKIPTDKTNVRAVFQQLKIHDIRYFIDWLIKNFLVFIVSRENQGKGRVIPAMIVLQLLRNRIYNLHLKTSSIKRSNIVRTYSKLLCFLEESIKLLLALLTWLAGQLNVKRSTFFFPPVNVDWSRECLVIATYSRRSVSPSYFKYAHGFNLWLDVIPHV